MIAVREFQLDYNVVQDKLAPDWPKIGVENIDVGEGKKGALAGNQTIGAIVQAQAEVAAQAAKTGVGSWQTIVSNARAQP
jgi:hypothetical protein